MNGNRLYRSTSEAIFGGVASGLGNYFKVDPTIFRIIFVLLTFFTGGGFILAYLAMWLLIPTAGSTASSAGDVVRENLDDMGARVRSGFGGGTAQANGGNGNGNANGNGNPGAANASTNGGPITTTNGGAANGGQHAQQHAQYNAAMNGRYGILPILLIAVGGFFLLAKIGFFHWFFWGAWPLMLIVLGLFLLTRRRA
jgi:phage shock protein PspC (stress-responsive transcriptional regulator)